MLPTTLPHWLCSMRITNPELFVLDAHLRACSSRPRRSEDIAPPLTQALLEVLGTKPRGPLVVEPTADHHPLAFSFFQLHAAGHIAGHCLWPYGRFHLDVLSDRPIDWKAVLRIATRHLPLASWRANLFLCEVDYRPIQAMRGRGRVIELERRLR